jgi:hypothetical protein
MEGRLTMMPPIAGMASTANDLWSLRGAVDGLGCFYEAPPPGAMHTGPTVHWVSPRMTHCNEATYSAGSPTFWAMARSLATYSGLRSVGEGGTGRL